MTGRITRRSLLIGAICWASPVAAGPNDIARAIHEALNFSRTRAGLTPLRANDRLTRAARGHAATMLRTGEMSHTAGGTRLTGRVRKAGYTYRRISENIAWVSRRNASDIVLARTFHSMWMGSSGHRKNMLDARVSEVGVGVVQAGRKTYAVQVFGHPK